MKTFVVLNSLVITLSITLAQQNPWTMSGLITRYKEIFPAVPTITTEQCDYWRSLLANLTDSEECIPGLGKLIMFDVRETDEYEVSHIPKASNMNPATTGPAAIQRIQEITEGTSCSKITVVFYCSLGYRSSNLANRVITSMSSSSDAMLRPSLDVCIIEGAIFKWTNEERDLVDGEGTKTIYTLAPHPYWGQLLKEQFHYNTEE